MFQQEYSWLYNIVPPRTIREALNLYNTEEIIGPSHNPIILGWARECGIAYDSDEIPWCGLFVAVVVKRSGWPIVSIPLRARSWINFQAPASTPSLGDVMVFSRNGGGHVGFYVAEDENTYHILGGNQSNRVNITRISKDRFLGARRPIWKIGQPESVRPYFIRSNGNISTNEQ